MKKVFLVFALIVSSVLMSSCTVEEIELSKPHPVEKQDDFSDAMMQRDSVSKMEDEIDPPVRPKPN